MKTQTWMVGVLGSCAVGAMLIVSPACGGAGTDTDGGTGFVLTTGIYKPTGAATSVVDGCSLNPNGAADPVSAKTYKINVTGTTVDWYGNPDGLGRGTPSQPSNGTGTLSGQAAVLTRDNDVPASAAGECAYHLKVTNTLTVTGDNAFSSAYYTTETNHTGNCATGHTDGCVTTWNWSLAKSL